MSMTLDRAIYDTAHNFPGGVPALAARINVRPGTLQNKVDPAMESHKLNVYELLSIMLTTGDLRMLYALNQEMHHTCVPLGEYENRSDMEVLDLALNLNAKRGEVDQEIRDSFQDGRITHDEKLKIRGRMQAAMRAQMELYTRLEALAEGPEDAVPLRSVKSA